MQRYLKGPSAAPNGPTVKHNIAYNETKIFKNLVKELSLEILEGAWTPP